MVDIEELKFDANGLIPAIIQDADSGRVLTLAYMNRESLRISLEKRLTCIEDYVRVILNREPIGLHVPPERFQPLTDWQWEQKHIAYMLDGSEQLHVAEKQYV